MKKLFSLLLAILLTLCILSPALAASQTELQNSVNGSASYMLKAAANPQVGSIGGEWAVLGLARSEYSVPESYYEAYYARVEAYVRDCGGVLSEKKYTEYSRVVLTLTAIGKDPENTAGYNLLTPLGDYKAVIRQGLTGPVWALIALDSGGYAMPECADAQLQATRQMYIDEILSRQLKDGGWNQSGKAPSDPDSTAMALQALAKYQEQDAVRAATKAALSCLCALQEQDGGYVSYGVSTCESVAQVIVALCELGVSLEDSRFTKNSVTLMDALMSFRTQDGGFRHTKDGAVNQMAFEQGFYALVAALRVSKGVDSLYRMDQGVSVPAVTLPGATFTDIQGSKNRSAIEALAERGIIDGTGGGLFEPDGTLTRAQFTAIVTRALGFAPKATDAFRDVPSGAWYAGYVGAAYSHGLAQGRSGGLFDPEGLITRQEAAVLLSRAAKRCGMDTVMESAEKQNALSPLSDCDLVANWAAQAVAFCVQTGITDGFNFEPLTPVLRCEMAQMLYHMLVAAKLI